MWLGVVALGRAALQLPRLPPLSGRTALSNLRRYAGQSDVKKIIEGRFSAPGGAAAGAGPGAGLEGLGAGPAAAAGFPGARAGTPIYVSPTRRRIGTFFRIFLPVSGISCLVYAFTHPDDDPLLGTRVLPEIQYIAAQSNPNDSTLTNWSATHEATPKRFFQPHSEAEVETFLRCAAKAGQPLRVVGSGLSPNGLAFSTEGALSMALMDKIIRVDPDKKQVTVQAGCRVQQVADALKPYDLTLQNYASIRDQQIGGFTQVGAHGTGARIPPVDDQIVSMRLVTPGLGGITLSKEEEPELFSLAKVGLGALGVVTQVTLQCVPRHRLVERTFTTTAAEVKKNHAQWLRENQHLRYMWIPHTDAVVVVQANPEGSLAANAALATTKPAPAGGQGPASYSAATSAANQPTTATTPAELDHRLAPLRDLYRSRAPASTDINSLTATQLRDALLALDPLSKDWVAKVNGAEAEFWRRSAGTRVGYSDEILGFDCGGQQWVLEAVFPVGKLAQLKGSTRDIEFMEALLKEVRSNKVAAPAPIEQRWTAGSSSAMSPASGAADEVHSWVGIIMYLPEDPAAREAVTQAFRAYGRIVTDKLGPRYRAAVHWAKLELPGSPTSSQPGGKDSSVSAEIAKLRSRLAARFPVAKFNAYREVLDPRNILANDWVNGLLGGTPPQPTTPSPPPKA